MSLPDDFSVASPTPGKPAVVGTVVFIVGLLVAPLWWHHLDVQFCWFRWAAGSGGSSPGAMYRNVSDCNYPPVAVYLMTATQWMRLHFGWAGRVRAEVFLLKLPNVLALLAGGALLAAGMMPLVGRAPAGAAACRYMLCPALFVDAAVWGQYDALVVLGMVAALLMLMRHRPGWAGVCIGAALAVKVQAFVVLPALTIYAWRRIGPGAVVRAAAAAAGVVVLVAIPAALGGGTAGVWNSYAKAVDYYRSLTIYAANFWEWVLLYREHVLHLGTAASNDDRILLLGRASAKQIGMAAFVIYTLAVSAALWRRPDRRGLVLAATLTGFGFFMLPTQIHERYILLAIAPLVLLTPIGYRRWYWTLSGLTAVGLLVDIYASNCRFDHVITHAVTQASEGVYLVSAGLNAILFLGLSVDFFHRSLFASRASADAWDDAGLITPA